MADSKNDLLLAAGNALHAWSGVELALAWLFEILSDINNQGKSHAIFDAIVSFDARLNVVDAVMTMETISDLDREVWNKLVARLEKKYKKRHEIAHFNISSNASGISLSPFLTQGTILRGEKRSLSTAEINERAVSFNGLRLALTWIVLHAIKRRHPGAGIPMPEPPLIAQLRALAVQTLEERERKRQHPADETDP